MDLRSILLTPEPDVPSPHLSPRHVPPSSVTVPRTPKRTTNRKFSIRDQQLLYKLRFKNKKGWKEITPYFPGRERELLQRHYDQCIQPVVKAAIKLGVLQMNRTFHNLRLMINKLQKHESILHRLKEEDWSPEDNNTFQQIMYDEESMIKVAERLKRTLVSCLLHWKHELSLKSQDWRNQRHLSPRLDPNNRARWYPTKEEADQVFQLKMDGLSWAWFGEILPGNFEAKTWNRRYASEVMKRAGSWRLGQVSTWQNPREDETLVRNRQAGKKWPEIAACCPGRSPGYCQIRYITLRQR